jgi:hypothetical protein
LFPFCVNIFPLITTRMEPMWAEIIPGKFGFFALYVSVYKELFLKIS